MTDENNENIAAFRKAADILAKESAHRESNPKIFDTPETSAQGYLVQKLHEMGRRRIEAGDVESIREVARSLHQSASGYVEDNAYKWLCLAFYATLGPIDDKVRAKIDQLAVSLLYAHINGVKSKHLVGFLYQRGGATKIRKALRESNPDLFQRIPKRPRNPKRAGSGGAVGRGRRRLAKAPQA